MDIPSVLQEFHGGRSFRSSVLHGLLWTYRSALGTAVKDTWETIPLLLRKERVEIWLVYCVFFFLKLDHSPTTSSQNEALLQQSRDVIPQSLVMVVVGRGCLHGWSMWSIKPAQVTIVKPYFTLVPCKEEIVSRTRFDVKLWPTLKRWNLWGSWDMFLCFCHGFFCHFSRECLYSVFKTSWCFEVLIDANYSRYSAFLFQGVMVSNC